MEVIGARPFQFVEEIRVLMSAQICVLTPRGKKNEDPWKVHHHEEIRSIVVRFRLERVEAIRGSCTHSVWMLTALLAAAKHSEITIHGNLLYPYNIQQKQASLRRARFLRRVQQPANEREIPLVSLSRPGP